MTDTPSRSTLERAFDRTPRFLRAISRHPAIASAMRSVGYTHADQVEGWDLLHAAAGFQREAPPESAENPAAAAIAELDAWDERGFLRARASLQRRHPEQAAFIFEGLKATTGPAAVEGVQTFLKRLDVLENGPERAATRDADHAALATLAKRGIDAAERARLAGLVEQAKGLAPDAVDHSQQNEKVEDALVALYGWYREWSEIARSVVRSRRNLIYLGLARQRRNAKDDDQLEL